MKKDVVTKLYDELTSEELATLAIHHLTELNELEVERIADAVPLATYEGPDLDYQERIQGFFDLASAWGLTHWQTYATMLDARLTLHILAARGERENVPVVVAECCRLESRMLALENAMLAVCAEHGIDPEGVRRVSCAEPFIPLSADLTTDAEYQEETQKMLSAIVSGRQHRNYSPRSTPTPH